ncbi:hypothetical protein Emed_002281 [Eimeria media]
MKREKTFFQRFAAASAVAAAASAPAAAAASTAFSAAAAVALVLLLRWMLLLLLLLLLLQVIAGCSAGAAIAAWLCTRTDAELLKECKERYIADTFRGLSPNNWGSRAFNLCRRGYDASATSPAAAPVAAAANAPAAPTAAAALTAHAAAAALGPFAAAGAGRAVARAAAAAAGRAVAAAVGIPAVAAAVVFAAGVAAGAACVFQAKLFRDITFQEAFERTGRCLNIAMTRADRDGEVQVSSNSSSSSNSSNSNSSSSNSSRRYLCKYCGLVEIDFLFLLPTAKRRLIITMAHSAEMFPSKLSALPAAPSTPLSPKSAAAAPAAAAAAAAPVAAPLPAAAASLAAAGAHYSLGVAPLAGAAASPLSAAASSLSTMLLLLLLQVNPHVFPFSGIHAHGEAGKPVSWRGAGGQWRGGFVLSGLELLLKEHLRFLLRLIALLNVSPTFRGINARSLALQPYTGDITVSPRRLYWRHIKLMNDQSFDDVQWYVQEGRLMSFPKLHIISHTVAAAAACRHTLAAAGGCNHAVAAAASSDTVAFAAAAAAVYVQQQDED